MFAPSPLFFCVQPRRRLRAHTKITKKTATETRSKNRHKAPAAGKIEPLGEMERRSTGGLPCRPLCASPTHERETIACVSRLASVRGRCTWLRSQPVELHPLCLRASVSLRLRALRVMAARGLRGSVFVFFAATAKASALSPTTTETEASLHRFPHALLHRRKPAQTP